MLSSFSAGNIMSAMMSTDRKSTRLNSSHSQISYAVFCLKKKQHAIGVARIFSRRETIVLVLLSTAVLAAVTYGVVTYQTPYGCGPNGVATGPGIDCQVLAEPCIYIYFTGIVGGSVLLILLIPVPERKSDH